MQIRGNIHVLRLISYAHRAKQHRQTCFFKHKIQPVTQTTVTECAI